MFKVYLTQCCFLFQWLPESPRYLIAAGEKEKGMEVLQRMAKMNKAKLPTGTLINEAEVQYIYLF